MQRPIVGYHRDEHLDWVAELSCGHGQHVRHAPPFTLRPWVTSPEGREAKLGQVLDCLRCDRLELPDGFVAYKKTPHFTENSVPRGLLAAHTTKPGVWGKLEVLNGTIVYVLEGETERRTLLRSGEVQLIAPEVKHRVELAGPVEFTVEFHRLDGQILNPKLLVTRP